MTRVTDMHGDL